MKETEYFKRAAIDAAFRKAQIEEQLYFISSGKVMFWFLGAPLIVFSLYFAFTAKGESATWLTLLVAMVCASPYGSHKTTLAALEALEDPKPSPGIEEISAAST